MVRNNKPDIYLKNARYMKILAHAFAIIGVVLILFVSMLAGLAVILAAAYIYFQSSKKSDKETIKQTSKKK